MLKLILSVFTLLLTVNSYADGPFKPELKCLSHTSVLQAIDVASSPISYNSKVKLENRLFLRHGFNPDTKEHGVFVISTDSVWFAAIPQEVYQTSRTDLDTSLSYKFELDGNDIKAAFPNLDLKIKPWISYSVSSGSKPEVYFDYNLDKKKYQSLKLVQFNDKALILKRLRKSISESLQNISPTSYIWLKNDEERLKFFGSEEFRSALKDCARVEGMKAIIDNVIQKFKTTKKNSNLNMIDQAPVKKGSRKL